MSPPDSQPVRRVVIADDDVSLRRLLRTVLEDDGRFEVVGEAEDGQATLRLVDEVDPDLLLLDLAMPRMDGLEVLQALEGRGRPAVVVLSGFVNAGLGRQVLEAGAATFLQKGVGFAGLTDELAALGPSTEPPA